MTEETIRCPQCSSEDLLIEDGIPQFGEDIPYFVCKVCRHEWPVPFSVLADLSRWKRS